MWKCKKCGCTDFIQHIVGGLSYIKEINEEGENTKYEDDIEYGEVFCKDCENTGETIEEIAYWEEC